MREIKFRAWDNDERKWFTEWENPNRSEWTPDDGHIELSITSGDGSVTLEQFTGIRDKNGKEIYEGDILRFNDWAADNPDILTVAPVVWYQAKCALMPQEYAENHKGGHTIHYWDMIERVEVIGNIHDNPELLNA